MSRLHIRTKLFADSNKGSRDSKTYTQLPEHTQAFCIVIGSSLNRSCCLGSDILFLGCARADARTHPPPLLSIYPNTIIII